MSTTVVKWQDPPVGRKRHAPDGWAAIVAELDARPGEWALVSEGTTTCQHSYLKTKYGLETRSVSKVVDGVRLYDLYARRVVAE